MENRCDDVYVLCNELENAKPFADYSFYDCFKKICKIKVEDASKAPSIISKGKVTRILEKPKIRIIENYLDLPEQGCVYAFVAEGKLIKIGETKASLKKRFQSYNCGQTSYRLNGTCSGTNFWILQNFYNFGGEIDVYAFEDKRVISTYEFMGRQIPIYAPYKDVEKIINEEAGKLILTVQK